MAKSKMMVADCRLFPSDKNCSLYIAGTEDEVLQVAVGMLLKSMVTKTVKN